MLEVYALHVRQLAAEENHVKVDKTQGTSTVEFEKNRKEVERVIEVLWSQERPFDHGNDVLLKLGGVRSNLASVPQTCQATPPAKPLSG